MLQPNKEQEVLLNKTFGCTRFVYNKMLAERKEIYEQHKDNKEELKKHKLPTPAKNILAEGIRTAGTAGIACFCLEH
jgi:transposase